MELDTGNVLYVVSTITNMIAIGFSGFVLGYRKATRGKMEVKVEIKRSETQ